MTRSWIAKLFAARPAPTPRPRTRLGVEALEDRTVPATFTVRVSRSRCSKLSAIGGGPLLVGGGGPP